MSPLFLELDQITHMHQSLIETYGGSDGIRDMGLLQSALSTPKAMYAEQFLHESLFEMAAAYLFHIVKNHPFVDGNKRTASASAIVFLALNDITIENDETGLVDIILSTIANESGKPEIAEFFQKLAH